ncbi:hypothetical protein QOM21_01580 [Streptomyces sp. Pv4-95]|uniref:hypothetical protein n=1 Tax=Streptomyces sp. Pv4-95 TaxID=3049543 RepID=UPI00389186A8
MTAYRNGEISHWMAASHAADEPADQARRRSAGLPEEKQDLVVIGGGLTGL